jgi:5'-nucleotidase
MNTARRVIYIDMDDVLCDYSGAHAAALANHPEIQFPQSQYGFYANLSPIEGAMDAANALYDSDRYEPYILTAPSIKNPLCYTEKRVWVERYLGMRYVERLIISPNKALLIGDILIDDQPRGRGQDQFNGRLMQFGSAAYPDWRAVRAALEM